MINFLANQPLTLTLYKVNNNKVKSKGGRINPSTRDIAVSRVIAMSIRNNRSDEGKPFPETEGFFISIQDQGGRNEKFLENILLKITPWRERYA